MKVTTASLPFIALDLLIAASAFAEPTFARLYRDRYGYAPSCNACHRDGGGSPLNGYGVELKKAPINPARFTAVEGSDSDGDGASNLEEILAKSNPGDARSSPKSPGDWLEPENLIPKEVQALFPGIRSYKPLDAILTPREIERAGALGVALGKEDDSTIFLPLEGDQPQGAAIIVSASFAGKPLFLLVAVDRKLTVTSVSTIGGKDLPAAARSTPVYAAFVGKPAKSLPAAVDPASIDGAIAASVRKAGAILFVRLKKE